MIIDMKYTLIATVLAATISMHGTDARFQDGVSLQGKLQAVMPPASGLDGDLGGRAIDVMLAAKPACDRYELADQIVESALPEKRDEAIAIAREFVNAEKNFSPFDQSGPGAGPRFCADASLPKTAELRGILPTIDPAVDGADAFNAAAAKSLEDAAAGNAADAAGKSVEELVLDTGFTNFFVGTGDSKARAGNNGAAAAAPVAADAEVADVNAVDADVADAAAAAPVAAGAVVDAGVDAEDTGAEVAAGVDAGAEEVDAAPEGVAAAADAAQDAAGNDTAGNDADCNKDANGAAAAAPVAANDDASGENGEDAAQAVAAGNADAGEDGIQVKKGRSRGNKRKNAGNNGPRKNRRNGRNGKGRKGRKGRKNGKGRRGKGKKN